MLFRQALGCVLRGVRNEQSRSLRDVARMAGVSVGYLSEVERGHKEASSELLDAIARALSLDVAAAITSAAAIMSTSAVRQLPRPAADVATTTAA